MKAELAGVVRDFLIECEEDCVGLWSFVRRVKEATHGSNSSIMEDTFSILTPLLLEGRIVAGQFGTHVFEERKITPTEIIAEIKCEWLKLSRDPDIGEILWFTAPWRH